MKIEDLSKKDFPELLKQIPDPPKKMRIIGKMPKTEKYLAVVGYREFWHRPDQTSAHGQNSECTDGSRGW